MFKKKKLAKLILKAIALYQIEHDGQGMPDNNEIIGFYVDKVSQLSESEFQDILAKNKAKLV